MKLRSIGGLRFQLTLRQTLSFAVMIALLAWGAYIVMAKHVYGTLDDELQDRSIAVRSMLQIRESGITFLKDQADPEVREQFESSIRYYQLLDANGKAVERSGDLSAVKLPITGPAREALSTGRQLFETVDIAGGGDRVRVFNVPVIGQQQTRYLLRVGTSLAAADDSCNRLAMFILVLFPIVLIIHGVTSWHMAGNALRPLRQISAAASHINVNEPNRRLPLMGAGDELEQLTATLNSMISGFQTSFQRTSEYLRTLSHELRQPLTMLRAETEQALRMDDLGAEQRQVLSKQLEHVELLSRSLSGLLALAQGGNTEIRLHRKHEDLDELVRAAVDGMSLAASEQDIRVTSNLQENVVGEFDAGQLWRLLLNLLDNATKFNHPGGQIEVTLTADQSFATITVTDTGAGIAREDLPRIFERSYRSSSARKAGIPGSGLGLHFARSIVEAHGGRIEVTSTPGTGASFRVTLPLHGVGMQAKSASEQHPSDHFTIN